MVDRLEVKERKEHELWCHSLDFGGKGVVIERMTLLGPSHSVRRQNGVHYCVEVRSREGTVLVPIVIGALDERLRCVGGEADGWLSTSFTMLTK